MWDASKARITKKQKKMDSKKLLKSEKQKDIKFISASTLRKRRKARAN